MGNRRPRGEQLRARREEEYRALSDLSGFEDLRRLDDAEARLNIRRKRRKKKKKKKKNNNNNNGDKNGCFGFQVEEPLPADIRTNETFAARDKVGVVAEIDLCSSSSEDNVEVRDTACGGVLEVIATESFMGRDEKTGNVDAIRKKEQADIAVQLSKALAPQGQVEAAIVIDLTLSSSDDDGDIINTTPAGSAAQMVPAERFRGKEMKKKRRRRRKNVICGPQEKQLCENKVAGAKPVVVESNVVVCQLLRRPRYFDFLNQWDTCSFCCEEGHMVRECTMWKQNQKKKKKKKPCFYCAGYGHKGRRCSKGQRCFVCKGFGHIASRCPEKGQDSRAIPGICLRCGDSGHDMMSCVSDYSPDDLKKIQCYVCKDFGHLCCQIYPDMGPKERSCYNCGLSGHLGSECTIGMEPPMDERPLRDYKPLLG